MEVCGKATWKVTTSETGQRQITNLTIYLDRRRDSDVGLVIHELLHPYLALDQTLSKELEEAIILALEKILYNYLHEPSRAQLFDSWGRAIERKIKK